MFIDLSILSLLDILSVSTAFMLGLLFFTIKSNNRKGNIFLGLFLWSLCIEVLNSFLYSNEDYEGFLFHTSLFTIPFLFIYVNQTLNRRLRLLFLLFFLPGIITNFVLLPHYFEYVFNIIILTYIIKILKGHRQEIGNFYSDIENKTLSWIRAIVFVFLFFHALWVIEDLVGILHEEITEYFAYTSNILTFLMIYWIGYNGFSQSEIFTSQQFQSYKKTTLEKTVTDIDTLRKFKEISETIYTKKIFADTDLTLRTLSITLNLKEKELSRIINKSTQKNFYHFINQFRIDEFKKLLSSPKAKQLSILGLAQEAGFSSKSTFYTAFKNIEGITPKEYQNQLKKSE